MSRARNVWLLNTKYKILVTMATFQVLTCHIWLVATLLSNSTDMDMIVSIDISTSTVLKRKDWRFFA